MIKIKPNLFHNFLISSDKKNNSNNLYTFYRSTIALDFIIKSIQNKFKLEEINVAIPFLYCQSTIEYLKQGNKKINFYFYDTEINECINIDKFLKDLNIDVLIIVHYFYKKEILFNKFIEKKIFIIEDSTHLENNNIITKSKVDFCILSPYKFYPIPFLSVLKIRKDNEWILNYYKEAIKNNKYNFSSFILNIIQDLKFITRNLFSLLINYQKIRMIDFEENTKEKINKHIILPSFISTFLYKTIWLNNNNLYQIHNNNLDYYKKFIKLFNKNWEVDYKKNSYMCRIKIKNTNLIIKYINELILSGLPFTKWPDNQFNKITISRFPLSYSEYKNNIYLPINISNNYDSIKSVIQRSIFTYINNLYLYSINEIKNIKTKKLIKIDFRKLQSKSLKIHVELIVLKREKKIMIQKFYILNMSELFLHEINLIKIGALLFIKESLNLKFKLDAKDDSFNTILN